MITKKCMGSIESLRTIPIEFLRECMSCDFDTGLLTWKTRPLGHFASSHRMKIINAKCAGKAIGYSGGGCLHFNLVYGDVKYRLLVHHVVWTMAGRAIPEGYVLDHINGNAISNRLDNLRVCTQGQNTKNMGLSVINTSGVTGVSQTVNGTWHAYIMCDGRRIHLGKHQRFEDAVSARKGAEEKYFGEFRRCVSV